MKKVALSLLAILSLVLMMALSAGIAAAGWDYEDCPPNAAAADSHASAQAHANWLVVEPNNNPNAVTAGNKANTGN